MLATQVKSKLTLEKITEGCIDSISIILSIVPQKSPQISADALYYLGVSKDIDGISGKFFNLTSKEELAPHALDKQIAEELWKESLRMVGLD